MIYYFFVFLILRCLSSIETYSSNVWQCRGAYINIAIGNHTNLLNKKFDVLYQYKVCRECQLDLLTSLDTIYFNNSETELSLESNYDYSFQVVDKDTKEIVCPIFEYDHFDECGLWRLDIFDISVCKFSLIKEPKDTYMFFYIILVVLILIIIVINVFEKNASKFFKPKIHTLENLATGDVSLVAVHTKTEEQPSAKTNEVKRKKKRVISLDTFRGFALISMILVIYGWDGYPFIHHLPWSGLNLGTLVFPWFLYIMGFAIPIAVNNELKKENSSKIKLLFKILLRSIKMFGIGLILNTSWQMEISKLRIFGVLQRISFCYFFMAVLEVICYKKIEPANSRNKFSYYLSDFISSWKQTFVVWLLNIAWFLITFLLEVPGCPKGYFGPGGKEYDSKYFNCTGGAAGYIDNLIVGTNHLYKESTPMKIYKNGNFDPEGILGTLTSIFLAHLGCQSGRVMLFHKSPKRQIIVWSAWIIIYLSLFFGLTQGDIIDGLIPVNKNIWTFTFSLISGVTGLGIFIIFYLLTDVYGLWTG